MCNDEILVFGIKQIILNNYYIEQVNVADKSDWPKMTFDFHRTDT